MCVCVCVWGGGGGGGGEGLEHKVNIFVMLFVCLLFSEC